MRYAGADWVVASLGRECSPLGRAAADVLGAAWRGIYHIDTRALRRVQWDAEDGLCLVVSTAGLATYDFDELTRLVLLAHDMCVRLEIAPAGPRSLRLLFGRRERNTGSSITSHPTLEEAVVRLRLDVGIGAQPGRGVEALIPTTAETR